MPQLNNSRFMQIKLYFNDPRKISAKSELDTIEVVVKESITVKNPKN